MLSKAAIAKTDLTVSRLCYGTNMLGTAIDQAGANAILDRFAELGGNFIDTARSYGDWMPDAPKGGFFDMRVGDYRSRVTPEDINSDLNESLTHLGIDTIDLYWLHLDNAEAPVGPIVDTLIAAKAAGKIRWFGASNWTAARVLEANDYAKSKGSEGFVAVEPFWGLAKPNEATATQQGYQLYFEDHCGALQGSDMTIIPYCSQSRGYFSLLEKGSVSEQLQGFYDNPANKGRFEAAKRIADAKGVSVGDIALAYLVNQPQSTIPIFGASSPARVSESVKAAGITLTAAELAELRVD